MVKRFIFNGGADASVLYNIIHIPRRIIIPTGVYVATEGSNNGYRFVRADPRPKPDFLAWVKILLHKGVAQNGDLEIKVDDREIRIVKSIRDYLGLVPADRVFLTTGLNHTFNIWEFEEMQRYQQFIDGYDVEYDAREIGLQ